MHVYIFTQSPTYKNVEHSPNMATAMRSSQSSKSNEMKSYTDLILNTVLLLKHSYKLKKQSQG